MYEYTRCYKPTKLKLSISFIYRFINLKVFSCNIVIYLKKLMELDGKLGNMRDELAQKSEENKQQVDKIGKELKDDTTKVWNQQQKM